MEGNIKHRIITTSALQISWIYFFTQLSIYGVLLTSALAS